MSGRLDDMNKVMQRYPMTASHALEALAVSIETKPLGPTRRFADESFAWRLMGVAGFGSDSLRGGVNAPSRMFTEHLRRTKDVQYINGWLCRDKPNDAEIAAELRACVAEYHDSVEK